MMSKEILNKIRELNSVGYVGILKESNTIEELCDEFVFDGGDGNPLLCSYEELIYWFNYSKEQQFKTRNCYGAIWIKGEHNEPILKSVTKMNEKGEFELLC